MNKGQASDRAAIEKIKQNLREQEDSLPADVTAKLAAARRNAVAQMAEQGESRSAHWLGLPRLLPAGGLVAAGIVAAILWPDPQTPLQLPALDDNEMAAASDMDMLDEIELIAWLLEQDADVG